MTPLGSALFLATGTIIDGVSLYALSRVVPGPKLKLKSAAWLGLGTAAATLLMLQLAPSMARGARARKVVQ